MTDDTKIKLKQRKERTGNFDVSSLLEVTEEDLLAELDSFKKTRERIEKNNERLLAEIEKLNLEEDKWETELQSLEKKSKEILTQLEDTVRKESFDWKRDQKVFQVELDQAAAKLEDMEGDLDEAAEKVEREQEKELIRLSEELVKLQKGDSENASKISRLEAELKQAETELEEADKEEKRIKREIGYSSEELNRVKKETRKFQDKVEELSKTERELSKEEEEKEILYGNVEHAKKTLKKLEKEIEQSKDEKKSLSEILKEIEDWQNRNEKIEKDHERINNETKTEKSKQKDSDTKEDVSRRRPGVTRGEADNSLDTDSRGAAREIEELEHSLEDMKKEYADKIFQIESKITDTTFEQNKLITRANRDEMEEINQLKAELKKIRDIALADETEKEKEINSIETDRKNITKELANTHKDLVTKAQESMDTKHLLYDLKGNIAKMQHQLIKAEYDLLQTKLTEDRIAKERKEITLQTENISQKLKETQDELASTKLTLSDLQQDYKDFVRIHSGMITDLESELFEGLRRAEENRRERFTLTKEIEHMRAYLKPAADQKRQDEENPELMERWYEQIRDERLLEVKKLKESIAKVRPKELSLKELQTSFQTGLDLLPPEDREDLGFELGDLNNIMQDMNMPTKDRFNMFVVFVEEKIDPGIVREIGRLLTKQFKEGLHPLKCAAHLLNLAKRDCKLDPSLKLREVLLDRLAVERYHRTHKEPELCKIIILEGGEENEQ